MKGLRLLNNGEWNKPPVLLAARRLLLSGLAQSYPRCPLGATASFLNGTSYDIAQVKEDGRWPIIRISNITDPQAPYLRTDEALGERFWVYKNDLLVSWSASFKSSIWQGQEGFVNQHIFKVSEKADFSRSYIRHAIEASFDEMQENVVGIGMMHLRRDSFLSHEIPVPSLAVQTEVATYLDWIEDGCNSEEPCLPKTLERQRRLIMCIQRAAVQIEEARRLRQETVEDVEALSRAIIADDADARPTVMRDLVHLRPPDVVVRADEKYDFAGVYSFGRGVFRGQIKTGLEFAYQRLTRLRAGNFVYPKLMAWEGALGVVPPECDGCVVSPEFPVFDVAEDRVFPEVLDTYFRTPSVWPSISGASTGTNIRRRRLNPQDFLDLQIPLPSRKTQELLRAVRAEVQPLIRLQAETAAELDVLLPSVLSKAFAGEL